MEIEIEQVRDRSLQEYWIKIEGNTHAYAVGEKESPNFLSNDYGSKSIDT